MAVASYYKFLVPLADFVAGRIRHYFDKEVAFPEENLIAKVREEYDSSTISTCLEPIELSEMEQLVLLIALAPHLQSDFYDTIYSENINQSGDFPKIGGARGKNFRGFLPTGETALFLIAGDDQEKRLKVRKLFDQEHFFAKKRMLWLEEVPDGEPQMSGRIILSKEYVDLFITGKFARPRFSMNFPAQLIETDLSWEDLVLHPTTTEQIEELRLWIKYGAELMNGWGMSKKLKPGYRALFHGPPGTGKTLTANLLGKYTGKEVYKIDLSMVVSKFIGETEKNLANLFVKAENKDWILFFDEADALFGKRTNVRDAHDKYANQEVSYLLQRVEQYDGLVILATNFKNNIDDAFTRRFQSIIYFPMPSVEERLTLWRKAFPEKACLARDISFSMLARKYELTGAEIINVVQFACLRALSREGIDITYNDVFEGIKREFSKEGKNLR